MNPRVGREAETVITPAAKPGKIFVAGAGAAGMEFALTARQRGHDVTIFEKTEKAGGQINLIGAVPGKKIFLDAAASLRTRCKKAGVSLKFNSGLSAKKISKEIPDVLAVATGAVPVSLKVPGSFNNAVNAWDVLNGKIAEIGRRVVIIGGGATGCETALYVANLSAPTAEDFRFLVFHAAEDFEKLRNLLYYSGRDITIVEMLPRVGFNIGSSTRWAILKKLRLMGVKMLTDTKVLSFDDNGLQIETKAGNKEALPADIVIIAIGARPENKLAQEVDITDIQVVTIGDAKEPRKIIDAIRDGFDAGLKV
jgi:2,4-dienoyl-CoA reductase (NADPH2)